MKKFTKVTLIIAAVFLGLGLVLCGIAAAFGANRNEVYQAIRDGKYGITIDKNWNVTSHFTQELGNYETASYTFDAAQIADLYLDSDIADVTVETADASSDVTVTMKNGYMKYFSCKVKGETLTVSYANENWGTIGVFGWGSNGAPQITISIPAGMQLGHVEMDTNAASILVRKGALSCQSLMLNADAADIELNGCNISDDVVIDVDAASVCLNDCQVGGNMSLSADAGDIEVRGGTYHDTEIECDAGSCFLSGDVLGDLTVQCDMGEVEISLERKQTDYSYRLSCDMGEVEINGQSYSGLDAGWEMKQEGAIGTIDLSCSMGSISVETE